MDKIFLACGRNTYMDRVLLMFFILWDIMCLFPLNNFVIKSKLSLKCKLKLNKKFLIIKLANTYIMLN